MSRFGTLFLVITNLLLGSDAQPTEPSNLQIGDQVCYEGYVMDQFCINRGTLLDAPSIPTLLQPDQHSVHCLIDVPVCRDSPFELLAPPDRGLLMYSRAFGLHESSKQGIVAMAARAGNPSPPRGVPPCTSCTGHFFWGVSTGFRAEVYGIVTKLPSPDGTPAEIHVVDASWSNRNGNPCFRPFPETQNPLFGEPLNQGQGTVVDEPADQVAVADFTTAAVGDEICFEGFVMDHFCIDRGTLLDAPTIVSLMNPELHSLHCLIDVPLCRESAYELLAAPADGETMYSRAFRLTENSKQGFLSAASAVGNPNPPGKAPCTECTGTEGSLNTGFRAEVYGVVVAPAKGDGTPAVVHVVDARASHDLSNPCSSSFPAEQNPEFGEPLGAGASISDPSTVNVGDEICFEGFVMDHFCIDRGTLLDAPDIVSLMNPELHSLHCLIDVPFCRMSAYELLAAPADGETMYSRAFRLTENSKEGFLSTAASVGNPNPPGKAPCTECTGTEGSLNTGFRAEVYGIVVAPAMEDGTPALVHVVDASASHDLSNPCSGSFPAEQNPEFGEPFQPGVGISDPSVVEVGDEVCFEGFVMDHFCIDRGTLLDAPDIVALMNPELHSLHCLIDVPSCRDSPYELLAPPGEGESMYTRAFRLTENSKEGILTAASIVGNPFPSGKAPCTECVGTGGSLDSGFRAEVYGVVVAPASADGTPALIHVVDARPSSEVSHPCVESFPPAQNPDFGSPLGVGAADVESVSVGDEICFEGFIMDHFCIERGSLLDAPEVVTLMNPELHSLHCLIDVPMCRGSPYEILAAPVEGETMYTRAFRLTENSKQGILGVASSNGNPTPPGKAPCTQCTGANGSLNSGFRAEVYGVVTALAKEDGTPAEIHVVDAFASSNQSNPCAKPFPMEQNPDFGQPLVGVADVPSVAVGDEICYEGFVMDHFCIARGTLLDAPDIVTLMNPELHSLHCLIDVPNCRESPYELLSPPADGRLIYSRAFRLTENSKEGILSIASASGNPNPPGKAPCTECVGTTGFLNSGFRAEIYGVVTAAAARDGTPALVHVVNAFPSHDIANPCTKPFPSEQNPQFGAPLATGTDESAVIPSQEESGSIRKAFEGLSMVIAFVAVGVVLLMGLADLRRNKREAAANKSEWKNEREFIPGSFASFPSFEPAPESAPESPAQMAHHSPYLPTNEVDQYLPTNDAEGSDDDSYDFEFGQPEEEEFDLRKFFRFR